MKNGKELDLKQLYFPENPTKKSKRNELESSQVPSTVTVPFTFTLFDGDKHLLREHFFQRSTSNVLL